MQILKDTFLISVDKPFKDTFILNGVEYLLDYEIHQFEFAQQIGVIEHVPLTIGIEWVYDNPLKVGDTILFHYHQVQEKHQIKYEGKTFYKCPYFQIWAKIENGIIIPMEDYLFAEPIQTEADKQDVKLITKRYDGELEHTAMVFCVGKQAEKYGIKLGDKIFTTKFADLEITVLDKKLWRMRNRNVIGIERNNKLICHENKILVKELEEEKTSPFIGDVEDTKERKGIIIDNRLQQNFSYPLNEGTKISFHNGSSTQLVWQDEKYSFINNNNINYVL